MPAFEQAVPLQRRQHQGKHALKAVAPQPLPDDRHAGVFRGGLIKCVTWKAPQRERVRTPGRNLPFALQAFKKPNHQHLEVNHRINARPATTRRIRAGRRTYLPNLSGEIHLFQRPVE